MKKQLYHLVVFVLLPLAVVLSACGDDKQPTEPDEEFEPQLSAVINGQPWEANRTLVIEQGLEEFSVSGAGSWDDDMSVLYISLKNHQLRAGAVLNLHDIHLAGCLTGEAEFSTENHTAGGTFVVTKYTRNELAGTFEFYAQDAGSGTTVHITQGKLRVPRK